MISKDDEKILIPDLNNLKFTDGEPATIEQWINCMGDIQLAIGLSTIFWPDFIEYEGYVFIKSHFSRSQFDAWKQSSPDDELIEYDINHIHISDFFNGSLKKSNDHQLIYFAKVLKNMYTAKLKFEFPEKSFILEFNESDFVLSFYQRPQRT